MGHASFVMRSMGDKIRRHLEERGDQLWTLARRGLFRPPSVSAFDGDVRFAIVAVNFSTTRWLKLMLLTLSDQEAIHRVTDIIIVDNDSRDGGKPFIKELARHIPRITHVDNRIFLNHAHGMRIGFDKLNTIDSKANVLLSIDTDVVFLRPNTLGTLADEFVKGAVLAGEMRHGHYAVPEAQASFLAVRRDIYWRPDITPWVNHGSPSYWMQKSIRQAGLCVADFPTYRDGYALHRGRAGVRASKTFYPDGSYASVANDEPHYMGVQNGRAIWSEVESRWGSLIDSNNSSPIVDELARRLR